MTFEPTARLGEVVCRLSPEEAERALAEGYLTIWPEEDRRLVAALAEARRAAEKHDETERLQIKGRSENEPERRKVYAGQGYDPGGACQDQYGDLAGNGRRELRS